MVKIDPYFHKSIKDTKIDSFHFIFLKIIFNTNSTWGNVNKDFLTFLWKVPKSRVSKDDIIMQDVNLGFEV